MNRKFTLLIFLICLVPVVSAQVVKNFTQRVSPYSDNKKIYNLRGDLTMVGNTNLTLKNYSDEGNNSQDMVYVDVDSDPNTWNSSSATLEYYSGDEGYGQVKPECTKIIFAGLYWMGRAHNSGTSSTTFTVTKDGHTKTFDKKKVLFKHNDTIHYTEVTAQNSTEIYFPTNEYEYIYTGYADVTEYVRKHGKGEYTVADMALSEGRGGSAGYFGGWGLIVIYENSKMKWRDITIFDGYAFIKSPGSHQNVSYNLPVSGFRTAQNGDIGMKLGIIAGEGDRSISGDYFEILKRNTADDWVKLKHSGNSENNFFNGSIPGTNPRNPKLTNNTGIDIAIFNINNENNQIIGNKDTTTKFRYGSNQDTYVISCIAMAVDAYVPDVQGHISITTAGGASYTPGSQITPGQEIEYELKLTNPSEERILGTSIDIPIPYTAELVNYSTTYNSSYTFTPATLTIVDTLGAKMLRWNIGDLPKAGTTELATLKFKLKATTNCFFLVDRDNCMPKVLLEGKIKGKGENSGRSFGDIKFISGYKDGECQSEPIYSPLSIDIDAASYVNTNCPQEPQGQTVTKTFEFCETPGTNLYDTISTSFPPITKFYSNYIFDNTDGIQVAKPAPGATEYTHDNDFPSDASKISESGTSYYAIPFGASACRWEIKIIIRACNYWVGENTTDWGTTDNWSKQRTPQSNEDIVFSTIANNGKDAKRDLVLDQDRTITKLVNETNFATVIPAGKSLKVKESIVGSETSDKANKIVVSSAPNTPNGTLIVSGQPTDSPVYATVQMYSKADTTEHPVEWEDNIPGSPTNGKKFTASFRWQFFGVPVDSVQADPTFYKAYIRKYDEKYNGDNTKFFQKWKDVRNSDRLTAFSGYEITQKIPETYAIKGKLKLSDTTLTLTRKAHEIEGYTGTDPTLKYYGLGQNIFGNSYTAAIKINQIEFTNTAVEKTVYLYNTGTFSEWAMNKDYHDQNNRGEYVAIPQNVGHILGIDQIPSMQGFLLKFTNAETVYNGTDADVTLKYNKIVSNSQPQRIGANNGNEETGYLKVRLEGKTSADVLWLIETPEATDNFDDGYDGSKLVGLTSSSASIFAQEEDINLQVKSSNSIINKAFCFQANKDKEYKLTIVTSNLDKYTDLQLLDLKTKTLTPVGRDTTVYSFTSVNDGDIDKRFMFVNHKTTTDIYDEPSVDLLDAYLTNNNTLVVNNMTASEGIMSILDAAGSTVAMGKTPIGFSKISVNLSAGVYVVAIKAGKKTKNIKIVVR